MYKQQIEQTQQQTQELIHAETQKEAQTYIQKFIQSNEQAIWGGLVAVAVVIFASLKKILNAWTDKKVEEIKEGEE
tara:strand:+ start:185 stop:412 length:228 start_codon:yes stop_codon:yes gene_type:complete